MSSFLKSIARILLVATPSLSFAEPISSTLVVPQAFINEPIVLNIQIPGERPLGQLTSTEATTLNVSSIEPDVINRQIFCLNVILRSASPGIVKVPSFTVPLKDGPQKTEETTLEVHPLDSISWNDISIDGQTYRIGAALLMPKGPVYEGQSIPVTAKILIPANLPVFYFGYAEIEKENIGVWRLDPAYPPNYNNQRVEPRNPNAIKPQSIIIEGSSYQVVNFTAPASPLKPGAVTVGPGTVQGLQVEVRSTMEANRGFFRGSFSRTVSLKLNLPETSIIAQALPAGAPPSFAGAVGRFSLDAKLDGEATTQPGDPISVQLTLNGHGNLDNIPAPNPEASETSWKIYPASRNEQLSERRSDEGQVVFSQLMRPLIAVKEVPPFVFSYFDPHTAKYETLRSQPIPVSLAPAVGNASTAPPPGLIPIPEMTDILGLIDPQPFTPHTTQNWLRYWHILPALITLALFGLFLKQFFQKRVRLSPQDKSYQRELSQLEEISEPSAFLRTACSLIEREGLAAQPDEFVQDLLSQRDLVCFNPNENPSELDRNTRKAIIQSLRERLPLFLLLLSLLSLCPRAQAATHDDALRAWDEGKFEQARDLYELALKEKPSPDLHFNLGNTYYRLEQPAQAALHYRRALSLDPQHAEARQNLAFLDRKLGTLPPAPDPTPAWARALPLPTLQTTLALTVWALLIAPLARAVFPNKKTRIALLVTSFFAIPLALASLILIWKHPGDSLKPSKPDALLIAKESTPVRNEASSAGSEILSINPATPLRILAKRRQWTYVELPDLTRGWLPSDLIEKI